MRPILLWLSLMFMALPALAQEDAAPTPPAVEDENSYYGVAVLQGLNKVTARISELEAAVGTSAYFGNLEIIVKRCWQSPPEDLPENAILLEIWERKTGETPDVIFNGWMFSSSPSLSDLEHPVYDVTALRCEKRELGGENPN